MKPLLKKILCASAALWFIILFAGCAKEPQNRVVLYCSVDDVYAKPIVADLEKRTGLKIDALYDVEAAKTAGLANRIRAEKERPHGDVFWSSALLQMLLLQREGMLENYSSPNAAGVPTEFKDPNGAWTGMGLRARIIMFPGTFPNGEGRTRMAPKDLLDAKLKNRIGISNPQFGAATDWVAAMAVRWGKEKTLQYFRDLKKNGVTVDPGNGVVAEKIVHGTYLAGVTDSDDYYASTRDLPKSKDKFLFTPFDLDRGVLVPGSVGILKGAPHSANARKLVDAILDEQTEAQLKNKMRGLEMLHGTKVKMPNDTAKWPAAWDEIKEPLAQILLKD